MTAPTEKQESHTQVEGRGRRRWRREGESYHATLVEGVGLADLSFTSLGIDLHHTYDKILVSEHMRKRASGDRKGFRRRGGGERRRKEEEEVEMVEEKDEKEEEEEEEEEEEVPAATRESAISWARRGMGYKASFSSNCFVNEVGII